MNGKSKIWAAALLGVALVLGGVSGAALDRALLRDSASAESRDRDRDRDRDRRGRYLDWLAAELDLTEDQRSQVESIIERHREQVSALWRETRPRFEELKQQLRSEIRDLLTEEQLEAYEALLRKSDERRHDKKENDKS
ncbi:MAG: hypothetical protein GWN99_09675 [Gemmatimonadetes bacterium]|uniref:Periplasmic heavy metal sensor n=1 Tax=Candidatus Kutchimonas denitrificans TaxID=3056748 RepID=A0AAE4Z8I7_9BACT|nr:hypothetical protein [Gemmatimonadota bacterium]NIR74136.1 hypothetical protein [Candidatus Kutchimonas denitrificans]NIS01318.1 hypothetical protein [Gemmatimonadota bacterium]NIT67049.1 hypothetical protein [Gemmatimonadota bacterium]NIU51709.1 hypothetical protein [Gemmatimonadota bacterium]